MIKTFQEATEWERRTFYNEEWDINDLPGFIISGIYKREFAFDHQGKGPNHRHNQFLNEYDLRTFLKTRFPYASYSSVSFYQNPNSQSGILKTELIFDIDAKDMSVRSCGCSGICEVCLSEAKDMMLNFRDTLKEMDIDEIHTIYSGRGYHMRVLDDDVMQIDPEEREKVLKYMVGANLPKATHEFNDRVYDFDHYKIPFGYPKIFTSNVLKTIKSLNENSSLKVNEALLKDILKYRYLLEYEDWETFKAEIGTTRYRRMLSAICESNLDIVDRKVTLDVKRILRLPGSLHSKVSMKCLEVKNLEDFEPLDEAVPKFVYER